MVLLFDTTYMESDIRDMEVARRKAETDELKKGQEEAKKAAKEETEKDVEKETTKKKGGEEESGKANMNCKLTKIKYSELYMELSVISY